MSIGGNGGNGRSRCTHGCFLVAVGGGGKNAGSGFLGGGTKGNAASGPSGAASAGDPTLLGGTTANAAGGPGGPAIAFSAAICAAGAVAGMVM